MDGAGATRIPLMMAYNTGCLATYFDVTKRGMTPEVLKYIKFRRTPAPPIEPKQTKPIMEGAYQFTLRSAPRHHDKMKELINSFEGSRVYFSEALAYLRGQGISLFRVEATNLDFLPALYDWWAATENEEAFTFDINLFFRDRDWVASLREHTPDEISRIIEEGAPRGPVGAPRQSS